MFLKKIPAITFFVAAVALAFWGWTTFSDRYSTDKNSENGRGETNKNSSQPLQNASTQSPPVEETTTIQEEIPAAPEAESFLEIKREDCLDGCKRFSKTEELSYCKQSCGLTNPVENPNDCQEKIGLEKDYCFKDLAIEKEDFKICEQISDKGIRKSCATRLTEELLDKQMQNSSTLPE